MHTGNPIILKFPTLLMDMNYSLPSHGCNASGTSPSVPEEEARHQKPKKKRTRFPSIDSRGGSGGVLIQTPRPRNTARNPPDPDASVAVATKIIHPCTECGKKFWSWKALFGHMRCHPERQWRGIKPPTNSHRRAGAEDDGEEPLLWTEEDHEVATWLLIMANGAAADQCLPRSENCSYRVGDSHSENMVGPSPSPSSSAVAGRFECSSCKKVFASHQALGGHRASHKNVMGCYAITKNDGENETGGGGRCCSRHFSNGQQPGCHMRCRHQQRKAEELPFAVGGFDLNVEADADNGDGGMTLDLRLGLGR